MPTIRCPKCSSKLKAPPEAAGKKARCSSCGALVLVPFEVQEPFSVHQPPEKLRPAAPVLKHRRAVRAARDDAAFDRRLHLLLIGVPLAFVLILAGGLIAYGVHSAHQDKIQKQEKEAALQEQRHQEAQEQQKRWAASQEKAQRDREVSEAKALQAQKEREAADRERARLAEQQRQEVAERERERMAHEEAMAEMRMVKDMTDLERSTAEHHFTTNTNGYRIDGLASPVYAVNEQGEEGRLYVISASKPVFDPSTFGYVRASFYFDFFMSGKTVVAWNRRTVGMPTTICKAVPNHPLVAPRVVRPHNSPPPSTQPPIRRGNSPPPSMQPRRTR